MSTRLLSVEGKVHELSDDLESHFFVLLFEGLHFLAHNKPHAISTEIIFDQAIVDPETGNHTGGQGKAGLYTGMVAVINDRLIFTSKPFTTLIRGLYRLFASLHDYHKAKDWKRSPAASDAEDVEKLKGGVGIAALFDEVLKSEEWPTECDKVLDQYLPTNRLKPGQKNTVSLSYFNQSLNPEPSSGKRKREPEGGVRRSTREKRSKVGPYK